MSATREKKNLVASGARTKTPCWFLAPRWHAGTHSMALQASPQAARPEWPEQKLQAQATLSPTQPLSGTSSEVVKDQEGPRGTPHAVCPLLIVVITMSAVGQAPDGVSDP